MCGRFALARPLDATLNDLGEVDGSTLQPVEPSWNIAPQQLVTVLRAHPTQSNGLAFARMTWGFRPEWSRSSKREPINARFETVSEKPMFREAYATRRCLVPMDGWYEWMTTTQGQQPWYHQRLDKDLLWAAGIHAVWENKGEIHTSVAMLTTAANGDCEHVHHRMPVLVDPSQASAWVHDQTWEGWPESGVLETHAVGREVNRTVVDHAGLTRPLPTLF